MTQNNRRSGERRLLRCVYQICRPIGGDALVLVRIDNPKMNLSGVDLKKATQEQVPQHEEFSSLFRPSDASSEGA